MPLFLWIAAGGLGLWYLLSPRTARPVLGSKPSDDSAAWSGLDRETQDGLLRENQELLARAAQPDAASDAYLLPRLRKLAETFEGYGRHDLTAKLMAEAERLFPGGAVPPPATGQLVSFDIRTLGDRCSSGPTCGVYPPNTINPTATTRVDTDRLRASLGFFPRNGQVDLRPLSSPTGPMVTLARVRLEHGFHNGKPVVHFIPDRNGPSTFIYIRYCYPNGGPCIEGWTDVNNLSAPAPGGPPLVPPPGTGQILPSTANPFLNAGAITTAWTNPHVLERIVAALRHVDSALARATNAQAARSELRDVIGSINTRIAELRAGGGPVPTTGRWS